MPDLRRERKPLPEAIRRARRRRAVRLARALERLPAAPPDDPRWGWLDEGAPVVLLSPRSYPGRPPGCP